MGDEAWGMTTGSAIVAFGLRKVYGGTVVLDGVDLDVCAGSVFALLGAHGAGKTTVVNVLTALVGVDGGSARVGGFDIATEAEKVRAVAVVGVAGRFASVDGVLSGRENLRFMADLHHLKGRRPRIVFLDEPTAGLDSRSRLAVWGIVRELVADGVTIFLTTRYLEEVDQLADKVAVLDRGKVVAEGTPRQLRRQVSGGYVQFRFADVAQLRAAVRVLAGATPDEEGLVLRVSSDCGVRSVRGLLERLDEYAVEVEEFTVHMSDLDDVWAKFSRRA